MGSHARQPHRPPSRWPRAHESILDSGGISALRFRTFSVRSAHDRTGLAAPRSRRRFHRPDSRSRNVKSLSGSVRKSGIRCRGFRQSRSRAFDLQLFARAFQSTLDSRRFRRSGGNIARADSFRKRCSARQAESCRQSCCTAARTFARRSPAGTKSRPVDSARPSSHRLARGHRRHRPPPQ